MWRCVLGAPKLRASVPARRPAMSAAAAAVTVTFRKSTSPDKKFMAVFTRGPGTRTRTVHFGAKGYDDYTKHHDTLRQQRYISRHGRGREDWSTMTTAGALSRWVLWDKPSLKAAIATFPSHFPGKVVVHDETGSGRGTLRVRAAPTPSRPRSRLRLRMRTRPRTPTPGRAHSRKRTRPTPRS